MRSKYIYIKGSQPVARGPKVSRQASRSGPRPFNKEKWNICESCKHWHFYRKYWNI